ncbi:MAG: DNA polymerase III subunit gamma/tau [Candidatus Adiutrix sp.]|nr:DNA polymerase III subunit gamma/tau [Candidatus Adiutrix sp.]
MSYLVLARKYRPQTFADLVGQEQVSRTLKNALATERVAHAYLFAGPRGVGKTTAARLLAMSLACLAEDAAGRPCGRCENCLEIQSGQAVDVIEVDGASNRGINEIRDLRETVKYLPAKSRRKVYIIDEVHALTKEAFGALLKTLEEPPAHVVFIFATTETHKMPPTILSRCQRYDFRRIPVADIARRLARVAELENIPAEPEALELIARQAEGGLRDSLSLLDQAIAAGGGAVTAEDVRRGLGLIDQTLVRGLVDAALAGEAAAAVAAVDDAYLRGYDFKALALKLLEYSRGLTLIKVNPQNAGLMNVTETEEAGLLETSGRHSLETLNFHFDAWLRFQREVGPSPQPRWLLEAQVIRLAHLAPLTPLAEVLERLEKLLAHHPPPPRPTTPTTLPPPTSPAAPAVVGPPSDWPEFLGRFSREIPPEFRPLLRNSRATRWEPGAVTIELRPDAPLGGTISKMLTEALAPLLERAWGGRPELRLTGSETQGAGADFQAEKLAALQRDPAIQKLLAELPGDFIEFRAGEPDEEREPPAEESFEEPPPGDEGDD